MSDYTTQLRFICESYAGRTEEGSEAHDVDSIISLARPYLFNFDYPIFDEAYKPELETKIMNHFYTQEIGQETVGLFKQRLKTKMREIMPYYNQLYMSERLKFDPFKNADYIDTHNSNAEGSRQGTNDNISGFSNTSTGLFQNTHNDNTDGNDSNYTDKIGATSNVSHEDGSGTNTSNKSGSESGTGTSNTTLEKKGTETNTNTPTVKSSLLHKEADTPLGSIDSGASATAVSNNGGYLSKVTQDINETLSGNTKDELKFSNRVDETDTDTTSNITKQDAETGSDTFEKDGTNSGTSNENTHDEGLTHSETYGSYRNTDENASSGESNSNTINTEETKNKQDYFGKVFGKVGSETYSEMLNKFRSTFLNIDMDVIHELEPLFMQIW